MSDHQCPSCGHKFADAVLSEREPSKDETTLCWKCCAVYPIAADKCPKCAAANGNVDFNKAQAEVFAPPAPPAMGTPRTDVLMNKHRALPSTEVTGPYVQMAHLARTLERELAAFTGGHFTAYAYEDVAKFFERWPGGYEEVESALDGWQEWTKKNEERAEKAERELSAANERLNAKVPEVEEQVRMAIVSFRLGDREAPVEVVPADLARDLGRRLAAAHATIDAAGAYEFRENILRGTMTDALERAEAAESALAEAVAKERSLKYEVQRRGVMFDSAINRLAHIHGLMQPPDVEGDGKRFSFSPPAELVYEAWRGLSEAIRAIPDDNAAAIRGSSEGGGNG